MKLTWRFSLWFSAFALFLIALSRMRAPYLWAETQFLFTYDMGFQRRGLFGEILSWAYPVGMSQTDVHSVALLMSMTVAFATFFYFRDRFQVAEPGGILLLLFATSIGTATVIGNTGYLDQLLVVLTLIAVSMQSTTVGIVLRLVMVAVGVLVHENMLPYFAPLIGLELWLRRPEAPMVNRLMMALIMPVFATVIAALVIVFGTYPLESSAALHAYIDSRALGFDFRPDTLDPLVDLPAGQGVHAEAWATNDYIFRLTSYGGVGFVMIALTFLPMLAAMSHRPLVDRIAATGAIVAPLSLMVVAFDVSRFMAIALLNVFLVAAMMLSRDEKFARNLSARLSPNLVVSILVLSGIFVLRDLNIDPRGLSGSA
ncbi:MAG: hypothetical protein GKR98_15600 [Boseongicola sp.]|nr:MAG: hypothetical protein GKR98_15600 [Boseongicola sp.]